LGGIVEKCRNECGGEADLKGILGDYFATIIGSSSSSSVVIVVTPPPPENGRDLTRWGIGRNDKVSNQQHVTVVVVETILITKYFISGIY